MGRRLFKLLLLAAICANLIVGWVVAAKAQVAAAPPTATSTATSTETPSGQVATESPTATIAVPAVSDPNAVTFTKLRQNEIQLLGPFEETAFSFFMPADWKLLPGALLHMSVGVSFNTVVQNQSPAVISGGGGTLTVTLNDTALGVLSLDQVGEIDWNVPIDPKAFTTTRSDGSMALDFVLNSGISCLADQHMNIFIHPTSYLLLPHDFVQPDTSLVNFPRPIFQDSFNADSALIVIPDHPSPPELQAALTVAAGLGNLSTGKLVLDVTTLSNFKPDQPTYTQATNAHLIFVGKGSSLPVLSTLQLPSPPQADQFQSAGGSADDGYVQMVGSPWSSSHVALVVTGNTDAGIVKAAQAVSTGLLRPNRFPNLAVIQEVQSVPVAAVQPLDQTLTYLGDNGRTFSGRGSNSVSYTFSVPPGHTLGADAYFELAYGNSALLNYDRSAITVTLNTRPIGSVRMTDVTASHPMNLARFALPSSAIQPGKNRIGVIVNMIPIDDCTPPGTQVIWISVWPQSKMHLPLALVAGNTNPNINLAAYPGPFAFDPLLSGTAFVLAHDDLASWRAAAQIAEFLGYQASGALTELSVFYGDDFPAAERAKYDLLVIGRASQLPLVGEMNQSLPAPFSGGADVASERNFQVVYRIPPNSPLGYLETLTSPWNPNRVVLAVLGNEAQGVSWGAAALIDPVLRSRLAGNFAAVNADQIVTTDTLAGFAAGNAPVPTASVPVLPPFAANAPAQNIARPDWLLPALGATSALVVLILLGALISSIVRSARGRRRGG